MKEGVSWGREEHSCVTSAFSSEKDVRSTALRGGRGGGAQDPEHRPWHGRLAFLLTLLPAGRDDLYRLAMVLGQLSPFQERAGHGTHLLVKETLLGAADRVH